MSANVREKRDKPWKKVHLRMKEAFTCVPMLFEGENIEAFERKKSNGERRLESGVEGGEEREREKKG
jgi:hypothetical protein